MNHPDLNVARLRPEAVLPSRAHPTDGGVDLCAAVDLDLAPGARGEVPTGWSVAIPTGWAGLILPRSGRARREGLTLTNSPGLIDAGYRGELIILVVNLGQDTVEIRTGERIAQLVLTPVGLSDVVEVTELPAADDNRGTGGFGSSGS